MEDEDEISFTCEDFVGDHFKRVIVAGSLIWRNCL
jgi:hypothetical protein